MVKKIHKSTKKIQRGYFINNDKSGSKGRVPYHATHIDMNDQFVIGDGKNYGLRWTLKGFFRWDNNRFKHLSPRQRLQLLASRPGTIIHNFNILWGAYNIYRSGVGKRYFRNLKMCPLLQKHIDAQQIMWKEKYRKPRRLASNKTYHKKRAGPTGVINSRGLLIKVGRSYLTGPRGRRERVTVTALQKDSSRDIMASFKGWSSRSNIELLYPLDYRGVGSPLDYADYTDWLCANGERKFVVYVRHGIHFIGAHAYARGLMGNCPDVDVRVVLRSYGNFNKMLINGWRWVLHAPDTSGH